MRFSIYQDSAIGGRAVNQDRMGYCFSRDALLMIVADGMGGHLRGEVAAQIATQSVAAAFQRLARPALDDPAAFLDTALRDGHREILQYQTQHNMPESPRTTVVACLVQRGLAWWAHAGDSRLYWMRDGTLLARTRDHSKVAHLVAMGLLEPHLQDSHPERNKVLNCLGSPFEPTIEISEVVRLRPGDMLMLCSDGIWGALPEHDLLRTFDGTSVVRAVPDLVRRSVSAGGRFADNATALAMRWEGAASDHPQMSSQDLPEGSITTTIDMSQAELEAPVDLTEADIERTISEIRSAIARTSAG
jgi:serine/threonine protein phosphatase PrpC